MTTLKEFIESIGITMSLTRVHSNPNMDESGEGMINYSVRLECEGRRMELFFSTGVGWVERKKEIKFVPMGYRVTKKDVDLLLQKGQVVYDPSKDEFSAQGRGLTLHDMEVLKQAFQVRLPTVEDVVECLAMDSASVDESGFEEWCGEMGYDTDSIRAKRTYELCVEQGKGLRRLVSKERYEKLLWEVERG